MYTDRNKEGLTLKGVKILDTHSWEKGPTNQEARLPTTKYTLYSCSQCREQFYHFYDLHKKGRMESAWIFNVNMICGGATMEKRDAASAELEEYEKELKDRDSTASTALKTIDNDNDQSTENHHWSATKTYKKGDAVYLAGGGVATAIACDDVSFTPQKSKNIDDEDGDTKDDTKNNNDDTNNNNDDTNNSNDNDANPRKKQKMSCVDDDLFTLPNPSELKKFSKYSFKEQAKFIILYIKKCMADGNFYVNHEDSYEIIIDPNDKIFQSMYNGVLNSNALNYALAKRNPIVHNRILYKKEEEEQEVADDDERKLFNSLDTSLAQNFSLWDIKWHILLRSDKINRSSEMYNGYWDTESAIPLPVLVTLTAK